MPLTPEEKISNQRESIRALYAEIDALRARLESVRAVLAREREKLDAVQSILAETMARRRNLETERHSKEPKP